MKVKCRWDATCKIFFRSSSCGSTLNVRHLTLGNNNFTCSNKILKLPANNLSIIILRLFLFSLRNRVATENRKKVVLNAAFIPLSRFIFHRRVSFARSSWCHLKSHAVLVGDVYNIQISKIISARVKCIELADTATPLYAYRGVETSAEHMRKPKKPNVCRFNILF